MSDTELKPCPFCGGKARFVVMNNIQGVIVGHIKCTECEVNQGRNNLTKELASNMWNRRINQHE